MDLRPCFGGSWVGISGHRSKATTSMAHIRGLMTPLKTMNLQVDPDYTQNLSGSRSTRGMGFRVQGYYLQTELVEAKLKSTSSRNHPQPSPSLQYSRQIQRPSTNFYEQPQDEKKHNNPCNPVVLLCEPLQSLQKSTISSTPLNPEHSTLYACSLKPAPLNPKP